jgi:hypothetical protein
LSFPALASGVSTLVRWHVCSHGCTCVAMMRACAWPLA